MLVQMVEEKNKLKTLDNKLLAVAETEKHIVKVCLKHYCLFWFLASYLRYNLYVWPYHGHTYCFLLLNYYPCAPPCFCLS